MTDFSHLDDMGNIKMVDISGKSYTARVAVARGKINMDPETVKQIIAGNTSKGNVLTTACIAGIQAAKNVPQLIPLCHQINLSHIDIQFFSKENAIQIEATAKTDYATGIEMEALTAVAIAALTIYDMCKGFDKNMSIGNIRLIRKTGGKSG